MEKMKQDFFETGHYYHIYNQGNNKENIFTEEKHYDYFLKLLKKYLLPISEIYAYCLLNNHFHILLRIHDDKDLDDKFVKKIYLPFSNLFNSYSKSFNLDQNRTGSLFKEHLQRNRVMDEIYLKQLVLYIHLNPLKHFNRDFTAYKYSSYQAYLSDKETNIKKEFILNLFEDLDNFVFWHDLNKIRYQDIIEFIDEYDD